MTVGELLEILKQIPKDIEIRKSGVDGDDSAYEIDVVSLTYCKDVITKSKKTTIFKEVIL